MICISRSPDAISCLSVHGPNPWLFLATALVLLVNFGLLWRWRRRRDAMRVEYQQMLDQVAALFPKPAKDDPR